MFMLCVLSLITLYTIHAHSIPLNLSSWHVFKTCIMYVYTLTLHCPLLPRSTVPASMLCSACMLCLHWIDYLLWSNPSCLPQAGTQSYLCSDSDSGDESDVIWPCVVSGWGLSGGSPFKDESRPEVCPFLSSGRFRKSNLTLPSLCPWSKFGLIG